MSNVGGGIAKQMSDILSGTDRDSSELSKYLFQMALGSGGGY
jgi:hypothetical protein